MYRVETYSFSPGSAGQGVIEIPGSFELEDIGLIINVTRNSVLYDPKEGSAGASVSHGEGGTFITLEQQTSYCSEGDKLQIQTYKLSDPLPVDIQGATLELTASNIEISNDVGNPVPVSDGGGSLTVDAQSLPLPAGASTEVKQDTTNTNLSNINAKLPSLIGGRVPVDLNEVEIKNDSGNPIPVQGTVKTLEGLSIPEHNGISLSYTGNNLTGVIYTLSGVTVASLTLSYDGNNNLTNVTKL